ncbi:uncharacterized protein TRIADDRAFT_55454 [Trichoplax adhaerens]|uniref:AB hydrolase-1 domain-containing protein n=1 Tax=Trichoplax adhaerens TaxID=10228 RepID=B3RUY1_TRIAD|nr:hypothetical protein TRIADDRAFT_55454 [Trichoplax adhaerens]EDV25907.1 hypothetical protein TRIADDRAFT_55454 [Trichoplax adhaerens]|eukprot:XP_002111940.1 hypothetical protein TRIADDRAFT_55454 [Trichoplax adhaerens]
MQTFASALALAGAGFAAIYAFYPVPRLSSKIEKWRANGSYKMFRDCKVYYRDEEGRRDNDAILLIHGFTQSSYDWRRICSQLKTINRRVVSVDMLGCGFSDKPNNTTYDLAFHADLYEHMMYELGIQDVHIFASDMGANVAMELLTRYEDRKRSKTSGSAQNLNINSLCVLNGRVIVEDTYIMPIEKIILLPYVGAFIARYVYGFHLFANTIFKFYGPTRYFIFGMADSHISKTIIDTWKRKVSEDSIAELDQAGHYPHLEKPQETFEIYKNFRKSLLSN